MSEAALIELVIKLTLDGALALLTSIKGVTTIDDAIAALGVAKGKIAQQYLDEAKANALTPPAA